MDWGSERLGDLCDHITKGTTPATCGFQFKQEGVDSRYVRYSLSSAFARNQIGGIGTKGSRSNPTLSEVRDIPIPMPSIQEQKKIAEILSAVDDAIEKSDAVIEKANLRKRGLMQHVSRADLAPIVAAVAAEISMEDQSRQKLERTRISLMKVLLSGQIRLT